MDYKEEYGKLLNEYNRLMSASTSANAVCRDVIKHYERQAPIGNISSAFPPIVEKAKEVLELLDTVGVRPK